MYYYGEFFVLVVVVVALLVVVVGGREHSYIPYKLKFILQKPTHNSNIP